MKHHAQALLERVGPIQLVPTAAASSDAPYGTLDSWQVMADAAQRATDRGRVLGAEELVSTATALAGYLSPSDAAGGPPRRIRPGVTADLCLLTEALAEAMRHPHAALVRLLVHGA